jgi:hypothetical protein
MTADIDLKDVPTSASTDPQRRAWLAEAFGAPDGYRIGEVVRYGATERTPMTVQVLPPGSGRPLLVRFEEERQARNHAALRGALSGSAARLRGGALTNGKIAGDAYYVLCSLARVVGRLDPLTEAQEWIDDYRDAATRIEGHDLTRRGVFASLETLRDWPYSKLAIGLHRAAEERGQTGVAPPRPPLLIDEHGREWTSMRHLGTFIRHDIERAEAISDRALAGRVQEIGGQRRKLNVWDRTDRARQERIGMVLVGFPPAPEMPDEDDLDGLDEEGV